MLSVAVILIGLSNIMLWLYANHINKKVEELERRTAEERYNWMMQRDALDAMRDELRTVEKKIDEH